MMGDVIELDCETRLPIPPEKVLRGAAEQKFENVIVVGYLDSGEFYCASSTGSGQEILWALFMAALTAVKIPRVALPGRTPPPEKAG